MNEEFQYEESPAEYLLKWMEQAKKERIHNPEAFILREPGLYIGGTKSQPGDMIINDNHGLPAILRAGTCE